MARLLPVLTLVAVGGMVVLYLNSPMGPGAPMSRNPMYMIFPVMMVISALGTLAHTARGRTAEVNASRRDYLRYLDAVAVEAGKPRVSNMFRRIGSIPIPRRCGRWWVVGECGSADPLTRTSVVFGSVWARHRWRPC